MTLESDYTTCKLQFGELRTIRFSLSFTVGQYLITISLLKFGIMGKTNRSK